MYVIETTYWLQRIKTRKLNSKVQVETNPKKLLIIK